VYPKAFAELTQLSTENSLLPDERKAALQLRYDILNTNAEKLGNYVVANGFIYLLGEDLFCVSVSLN